MNPLSVAVLIDGGFFLKRYFKIYKTSGDTSPEEVARKLYTLAMAHVGNGDHLYRIFYYDAIPFNKRLHNPISSRAIDYATTPEAKFRETLFEELKKKRKLALRLGYIKDSKSWIIRPRLIKDLCKGNISFDELTENDVYYDLRQKGIDMKIGVDIATISIKKLVNQIVLISGDADFVPAAKLARREGVDFILDPMWNHIDDNLFEHIDGLRSTCPKPTALKS